MKNPILVIFGGSDHEEQAARKVCKDHDIWTATATVNGTKCHAGNAYQANGYVIDGATDFNVDGADCIIFECNAAAAGGQEVVGRCDHHNPGDPGYALGPDRFWEASSLGQLCSILGVSPTEGLLMVAAGDHCPAAAYKGLCPGVDAQKFKTHRIAGLATAWLAGVSPTDGYPIYADDSEQVEKAIDFATKLIRLAPESSFVGVKDLRQYGKIDQLPEAALIAGYAYISQIPDTDRDGNPTGNVKINLGGDNSPETVKAVMEWLNRHPSGMAPAYGVPSRGFAGRVFKSVHLPDPSMHTYYDSL